MKATKSAIAAFIAVGLSLTIYTSPALAFIEIPCPGDPPPCATQCQNDATQCDNDADAEESACETTAGNTYSQCASNACLIDCGSEQCGEFPCSDANSSDLSQCNVRRQQDVSACASQRDQAKNQCDSQYHSCVDGCPPP
jgi:hypothetical protein